MTTRREREAEDEYEARNDPSPVSGTTQDNSYAYAGTQRGGQIPVRKDEAAMEDPITAPYSNTDAQLARDENEAINKSNAMRGERTRHAKPQAGSGYSEGPDEEDLPPAVRRGEMGQSDPGAL